MKRFLPLLLLLVLVSCSKNEYVNLIPKDASFVLSVDVKSIAEKSDFTNSPLYPQFLDLVKGSAGSSAAVAQQYIDDPAKMGIDFREPVYLYQSADMYCMVMAVYDKGDLEDFLETLRKEGVCGEIEESDGLSIAKSQLGCYFAFNKKAFLITAPSGSSTKEYCKQFCKRLFDQKEEESFHQSEAYSEFEDLKGELAFYADLASLPQDMTDEMKAWLPENVRHTDVQLFSSFVAENGKAVWSTALQGKTKNVQDLIEEGNKYFQHIEGDFLESPMQNFSLWACMGVEKGALLSMLKESDTGRQMLMMVNQAIGVEQILRQVEGDVSVVLPSFDKKGDINDFLLFAKVDDDDFMDDVEYWQKSMKNSGLTMTKTMGKNYVINGDNFAINWGLDEDKIYFATPKMFAANSVATRSDVLLAHKEDIKDSYFYMYINVPGLFPADQKQTGSASALSADKVLEDISSIVVQSKEHDSMDIIINLTDQSQNFLKALFQ